MIIMFQTQTKTGEGSSVGVFPVGKAQGARPGRGSNPVVCSVEGRAVTHYSITTMPIMPI